jgi:hypothetical protein
MVILLAKLLYPNLHKSRLSALKLEAASLYKMLLNLYQTGRRQEALRLQVCELHVMVGLVTGTLHEETRYGMTGCYVA